MILVTRPGILPEEMDEIRERAEALDIRTHVSDLGDRRVIGCVGDEDQIRRLGRTRFAGVEEMRRVDTRWKLASRRFEEERTQVRLGFHDVGGPGLAVIAGPCSLEGREMIHETARAVHAAGAIALRAGVFKPRTSPYGFQGLGQEGLEMLAELRAETGLPIVTEVTDPRQVDAVAECVDVLQIGTRNMYNYDLLKEVGRVQKPVLLKRGFAATIAEFILAAEYVLAQGNPQVILCERGIRTFETMTRNTLDVSAVPVLKRETHLPVIIDPSHAAGDRALVPALALAGVAAGADGLLVEVHPEPDRAFTDGAQSLNFVAFAEMMVSIRAVAEAVGREMLIGGSSLEDS